MATRPATRDEIRRHLGHGRGNRRVYIAPDGAVLMCGSIYEPREANVNDWQPVHRVEEYEVLDDVAGVVVR